MEEKGSEGGKGEEEDAKAEKEEERRLLGGMGVLDFNMLCSAVAMQTQGKWNNFGGGGEEEGRGLGSGEAGGVRRICEGEFFLDCFEDRPLALQSAWEVSFGSSFVCFGEYSSICSNTEALLLYLAVSFTLSVGECMGFFRMQMRKKLNIKVLL